MTDVLGPPLSLIRYIVSVKEKPFRAFHSWKPEVGSAGAILEAPTKR